MQRIDDQLFLSASDLINYLECRHLTYLDLGVARGEFELERTRTDAADLLAKKGDEHELAHLESLQAAGRGVVEIDAEDGLDGLARGAESTREAMRAGADVIYQGVLFDDAHWLGYADFLERVDRPSDFGSFSYEVADTKLARRVKPYFLVQLCFYSELLGAEQGVVPEWTSVVLGSRARERFRLREFLYYYRSVKRNFEAALDAGLTGTYPDPVDHCEFCRWDENCASRREADDHLSLVANMRRTQIVRLGERRVTRVDELALAAPADRPPRIGPGTFETLRAQASLQIAQRTAGAPVYELLDLEPERGFLRMPHPSPGDIYFDMEGDPFFDDGLEYLFGAVTTDGGESSFRAFWATSRVEEELAFEAFIDFVMQRLEEWPEMHIYHYAPYEPTALKRLMGLHATREDEVDHLLRNQALVDLYAVVRQSMRIGEPSYSIKNIEHFYMGERENEVAGGGDATVAFEEFLETGDRSQLEAIERYNEDDCRSTLLLHGWLLERREEAIARFDEEIPWHSGPDAFEPDPEEQAELDRVRQALAGDVPEESGERGDDQQARWLLAQLLDYHRREAKPAWWEYFDRLDADQEQLIEVDNEALAGLEPTGEEPTRLPPPARSLIHRLRFPPQEHKIGPGSYVDPATEAGVNVEHVDDEAGIVEIRRATNRRNEPLPRAIIPCKPYKTNVQQAALRRFADDVLGRGLATTGRYSALRAALRRDLPNTSASTAGEVLQEDGFDLARAKDITHGLQDSYLFIQGPPGSGKTYTGAHLILDLIQNGARVGVASSSHAAIHNLLHEVERFAPEGEPFRGVKRGEQFESRRDAPLIRTSDDLADCLDEGNRLVAGTAWLFAREEMEQSIDYLFVDEAGQISLADALAMATSARNLVLLGDPNQLAQVSRAIHPPGAGASVLEHLLGEDTTIPRDRGLFIDRTRRMHPDVCRFVSEAIYEGRLEPIEECTHQGLDCPGLLTGTGVRYVPVEHQGNARQSPEEASSITALVTDLLRGRYIKANGDTPQLAAEEIMVVAPYNAQVRCLRQQLPDDVRVGTVDKFQGQEAAVCFFSMATSSGMEVPRNLEFLFSRNRLNVAISRARCLAVLVCSPELLHIRCRSAQEMRLVNALCQLAEMAPELSAREI